MDITISFTVNGNEVKMTLEEAQDLYRKLGILFDKRMYPTVSGPYVLPLSEKNNWYTIGQTLTVGSTLQG